MKLDVAIIDYKISNMFSVNSACNHLGLCSEITDDADKILAARSAILPGVGAFAPAIARLKSMELIPVINEFIKTGKPFMGICLGLQLLFTESEEFGIHKGLNIIPGKVKKFPQKNKQGGNIKIPNIGWRKIKILDNTFSNWHQSPLSGIDDEEFMYFVHSFYVVPKDNRMVLTSTDYEGAVFCSSVSYKNIFACQFHPEKSGKKGLRIFKNFAESIKN